MDRIWLLPDNKIYMPVFRFPSNYTVFRILEPDLPLDTTKMDFGGVKVGYSGLGGGPNMIEHFPIQRVGFEFDLGCNGLHIYNRCDTGFFANYQWTIGSDSFVQSFPHVNRWNNNPVYIDPENLPQKSGKYYITMKATKGNGFANYAADSFYYILRPKAKFTTTNSQGCQYIAFTFYDSSYADTAILNRYSWHYYFGDGKDTIISADSLVKNLKVNHIYTSSGVFNVRLIFSNGFCTDTFNYINIVNILPAPKPGFSVNAATWCGAPLKITISTTTTSGVVRYYYDFGNGDTISTTSQSIDHTYQKPGSYTIVQRILGTTGCITSDSTIITILNGLSNNDTVEVLYTTVLDNSRTKTVWRSLPYALSYRINSVVTTDTFYIDVTGSPDKNSISYSVKGIDSCGNSSAASAISKTISLSATNVNSNDYAKLEFSPYEFWRNGVQGYDVEYFNPISNQWELITSLSAASLNYNASLLPKTNGVLNNSPVVCYRIAARESSGNNLISYSDTACVPIYPIVFIPTAFSPNNDGLNELYKPICAGLNNYVFEIYNRWGELVYTDTPESLGWDGTFRGKPAESGVYVYRLSAVGYLNSSVTNDARYIEKKGSLSLIR